MQLFFYISKWVLPDGLQYLYPKMINIDALDFSECHISKEMISFFWCSVFVLPSVVISVSVCEKQMIWGPHISQKVYD